MVDLPEAAGPSILAMADLTTPMAVRVAATLGLVDLAGGGGATASHLAAETGASLSALGCLLDHLVAVGVFSVDVESGRYRPTELGAQMGSGAPEGVRPLLDINCAGGRAELAFVELLGTVVTGASGYEKRYGLGFWEDLDAQPELRRSFDAQMAWRFRVQGPQIASGFDWGRFGSVVDVGGGDGVVLAEILRAHPSVSGRVVDLAPAAAAAGERFLAAGFGDRAGAVAGSFFDPLPVGADAYLLSDILHNWDDSRARAILAGCRRAAGADGVVVVIEAVRGQGVATAMDLSMLVYFGGRERTVDELVSLADGCGLVLRRSGPVAEGRTVLEFGAVG